jgi:hypothetical protein
MDPKLALLLLLITTILAWSRHGKDKPAPAQRHAVDREQ